MAARQNHQELKQRVKALEKGSHERKRTEEALRESTRRLELAYDQSIIYAQQLREEIAERKRVEEGLRNARKELEVRVAERTAELLSANERLKLEIAERRGADEALHIEKDNLVNILNAMEDMVYIINQQCDMEYANPTLVNAFGPIQGKRCYEYFHGRTEVCPWCKNQEVYAGKSVRWEWQSSRSGRTYEVIDTLVKRSGGEMSKLAILRDVTERKRLEEQKRRLETKLLQTHKMDALGRLAGGIAREFYEIIGMIIGNAELALYSAMKEQPAQQNLEEVLKACIRGEDVVSQILTFSRHSEQKKGPLMISSVVEEAIKLLRTTLPATTEIRQRMESGSGRVLADRTQIQQAVLNLCTNAAWAMGEKGGVIEVTLEDVDLDGSATDQYPDLNAGSYVRLTVSDTGCGIDPSIQGRVFDPYFTTKRAKDGSGMGLAVVYGIVEGHGGVVTVESEVGKGTNVHVFLPKIEERGAFLTKASEYPLIGNERILFVDDDQGMVDMGKQMLESLGYEVIAERGSTAALGAFRAAPQEFDLVITDQIMPNMTGKMLAEELLRMRPDIPIILCTVRGEEVDEEEAKAMGIQGFITKPIMTRVMAEVVREVLHKDRF